MSCGRSDLMTQSLCFPRLRGPFNGTRTFLTSRNRITMCTRPLAEYLLDATLNPNHWNLQILYMESKILQSMDDTDDSFIPVYLVPPCMSSLETSTPPPSTPLVALNQSATPADSSPASTPTSAIPITALPPTPRLKGVTVPVSTSVFTSPCMAVPALRVLEDRGCGKKN